MVNLFPTWVKNKGKKDEEGEKKAHHRRKNKT
jgi:hypothetical protein